MVTTRGRMSAASAQWHHNEACEDQPELVHPLLLVRGGKGVQELVHRARGEMARSLGPKGAPPTDSG
eukprot:8599018-Pyramimonas_sp.AAC.1